ncbi:MAG: TetR-like C-terminal domain-containing protein [Acidimicrobiales bacterium]
MPRWATTSWPGDSPRRPRTRRSTWCGRRAGARPVRTRRTRAVLALFLYRPDAIELDLDTDVDITHGGADSVFDAMLANLRRAIDDGDLAEADPLDYGLALWAAVHGVATVAGLAPGLAVDPLLDRVVGSMLDGWRA